MLIPSRRHVSPRLMNYINIFGGAFLFASCFINLVPHMFLGEDPYRFVTPNLHFKIAAAVMVGFLIQLLLEQLTHGAEHGHGHLPDETLNATGHPAIFALLIGLCIHAFLEGMPMVDLDGDIHQGLLYGIVLHNIPIALVLVGLFISHGYGFWRSFCLLLLFAVMTPLGSLCNLYLIPENEMLQSLIMGVVVGILLHVSVNILFDHHNAFSWGKLLLILAAFVAAYFTPGCPEIYSTF
jgi:zinc transporter ZupT